MFELEKMDSRSVQKPDCPLLPVFVQLIHNTISDTLSILLIPNFINFNDDLDQLKDEIIEVDLDQDLVNLDQNYALLFSRYGMVGTSSMMITNATTMFISTEFRNLITNILFMYF